MIALEAEQQLLGCIIYENETLATMASGIQPHHFYEPFHQKLFAAISEDISLGRMVNPITISGRFTDDKAFADLGGLKYLAGLVDIANPISSADYARVIINAWQIRELGNFVKMPEGLTDAQEAIADLKSAIDRIDAEEPSADDFEDAHSIGSAFIDELTRLASTGQRVGLQTGLTSIDVRLGGLSPGDLIVVGGRPGQGKTSYGRNVLYGAAEINPDHDFLFYNLEMNKFQISGRALSCEAFKRSKHFPYFILKTPTDAMIYDIGKFKEHLPKNVLISEKKRISVEDVRRSIVKTKARRKRPIGAIVIDYLQLMQRDTRWGKSDASTIGDMTAELKRIAGDHGITIILISQLSRAVEGRDNKRPMLSDLRDSGSIEQDASIVQFPFREHYYLQHSEPSKDNAALYTKWEDDCEALKNKMDVITAKLREGAVGTDEMWCSMAHDYVANYRPDAADGFGDP